MPLYVSLRRDAAMVAPEPVVDALTRSMLPLPPNYRSI